MSGGNKRAMKKQRIHREWFRSVSGETCPTCKSKVLDNITLEARTFHSESQIDRPNYIMPQAYIEPGEDGGGEGHYEDPVRDIHHYFEFRSMSSAKRWLESVREAFQTFYLDGKNSLEVEPGLWLHYDIKRRGHVWSWGEYVNAKWRTVRHFCEECWPECNRLLRQHRQECGCDFELVGYRGESLPAWLDLD